MANIEREIETIESSIYGRDITKSIVDGLNAVNEQVETVESDMNSFETRVNGDINTFNNTVNEVKQSVADIQQLVDNSKDVLNNASQINDKIDTLGQTITQNNLSNNAEFKSLSSEMLRENYIPNSIFSGDSRVTEGIASSEYGFAYATTGRLVEKGKTYTLTVCGSTEQKVLDNGGYLMVCAYDDEWSTNGGTINIKSTTPIIQSVTFVATKTEYLHIGSYLAPQTVSKTCKSIGGLVTTYWYTLVEGDTGTEWWTPSPYDLNGGVNLFGNSNFGSNGVNLTGNGGYWNDTEVELVAGMPYTFTACATIDKNDSNSKALCMIYTDDWSQCPALWFASTDQPRTMSITFIPTTTQTFHFGFYSRDNNGNGHNVNCNLKWYTLVQGGKATAWCPSMKDIQGKTSLQLASLGHMTTQMMLVQANTEKEAKVLGKSTTQLIIENNQLKEQNGALGKQVGNLTLENNQLKEQMKTVAQIVVQLQLKNK